MSYDSEDSFVESPTDSEDLNVTFTGRSRSEEDIDEEDTNEEDTDDEEHSGESSADTQRKRKFRHSYSRYSISEKK